MEYINIGKFVSTHGIKGEIRIKSNSQHKDKIFNIGNKLYFGTKKKEFIINSYRVHKDYDMVTLNGINNINDVLYYKGMNIYIDRSLLGNITLDEDLIGFEVIFNNNVVGKIKYFSYIKNNNLIIIDDGTAEKYIPYNKDFIENIDFNNRKMYIKYIEGLL